MAKIIQKYLFSWKEIESKGDLERLELVLQNLNDEKIISTLEKERKNGRDEYPIRAVWNSCIAGLVFQHPSIASLIRELKRNAQLRELCGFNPLLGEKAIPPAYVYTRFMKKLTAHQELIDEMFNALVEKAKCLWPDFGKNLAGDGKAIQSFAKNKSSQKTADGRRDIDAEFGVKSYTGLNRDGTVWKKNVSWFGYKLHLIADTIYELPVAYEVTAAPKGEKAVMKQLLNDMENTHSAILEICRYFFLDKGYDCESLTTKLWDEYQIKPLIDIRNMWKDGEETKLLPNSTNIVYDYKGIVSCYCPVSDEKKELAFSGFEAKRQTLKYLCPMKAYGISCLGKKECSVCNTVRIPLKTNRRIFTPVARSSYKWKQLYKSRTAVERINSRLDVSFGFENHTIRGLKKMKARCGLALSVMLAMAVGRCQEKKEHLIRSLVRVA